MAWILFASAFHAGIPRVVDETTAPPHTQLFINTVVPGSPAEVAGAKEGDEITKVVDIASKEESALTPSKLAAFVKARGGKEIEMTFKRSDAEFTAIVRPAHAVVEESSNRPAVGVGLVLVTDESMGIWESITEAGSRTVDVFHQTAFDLWGLVRNLAAGEPSLQNVVGPVGLVDYVGNATRHGFGHVLALAGFISVNLAVINLIPIPALDGGRLVLVGIEAVLRRPPKPIVVQIFNITGIAIIVLLMVVVTYHDLARLLS
jgi:regulator of sigma E protease